MDEPSVKRLIYTHVLNRGPGAVRSPVDRLPRPGGGN